MPNMLKGRDPVEIEGSKARAQDRGQPDGFHQAFDKRDEGDNPYLGDKVVVEGQLRTFALAVVDVRKRFNEDKISGEAAQKEIGQLADRYGDVFTGKAPEFRTMGPWNSEAELGHHLRSRLGVETVDGFFWFVARQVLEVAIALEGEEIDEDIAQFRTEALIEDGTALLLGITPDPLEP